MNSRNEPRLLLQPQEEPEISPVIRESLNAMRGPLLFFSPALAEFLTAPPVTARSAEAAPVRTPVPRDLD